MKNMAIHSTNLAVEWIALRLDAGILGNSIAEMKASFMKKT